MTNPAVTGPPYPPLPGAGSNAIGRLAIGEGQIGDIAPFDWRQTVISQYANSTILTGLIERFADAADQTANIESFFDLIMNLDTAQGYGLDVWGRIVGVERVLQIANVAYFGFAEALPGSLPFGDARFQGWTAHFGFAEATDASPFNQAPFGAHKQFAGVDPQAGGGPFFNGEPLTSNYRLSDDTYRTLIIAKAAANITNGSYQAVNQILMAILFPNRGNCFVADGMAQGSYFGFAEASDSQPFNQAAFYDGEVLPTMQMQYVFRFQLTPVELAIVAQSGVLPKSTGVAASIVIEP